MLLLLPTHGTLELGSGRFLLRSEYRPGDVGPRLLSLELQDQRSFDIVEGRLRLDPWIADEYQVYEPSVASCIVLHGAEAVVAVDLGTLSVRSSMGLEYKEACARASLWHVETEAGGSLVVSTDRRTWCLDERGSMRWVWSCETTEVFRRIVGPPVIVGDLVRVTVATLKTSTVVALRLSDGLRA